MSFKMTEEWHAAAIFLYPFDTIYPIELRYFEVYVKSKFSCN